MASMLEFLFATNTFTTSTCETFNTLLTKHDTFILLFEKVIVVLVWPCSSVGDTSQSDRELNTLPLKIHSPFCPALLSPPTPSDCPNLDGWQSTRIVWLISSFCPTSRSGTQFWSWKMIKRCELCLPLAPYSHLFWGFDRHQDVRRHEAVQARHHQDQQTLSRGGGRSSASGLSGHISTQL